MRTASRQGLSRTETTSSEKPEIGVPNSGTTCCGHLLPANAYRYVKRGANEACGNSPSAITRPLPQYYPTLRHKPAHRIRLVNGPNPTYRYLYHRDDTVSIATRHSSAIPRSMGRANHYSPLYCLPIHWGLQSCLQAPMSIIPSFRPEAGLPVAGEVPDFGFRQGAVVDAEIVDCAIVERVGGELRAAEPDLSRCAQVLRQQGRRAGIDQ